MLKFAAMIMAGFLVLAMGSICLALDAKDTQATNDNPGTKLGNGLGNALTGWMEIPRQVSEVSSEQNAFAGMTYGLLQGVLYGTGRTAAGAFDAVTFVIPPYDKPIMEPNYNL